MSHYHPVHRVGAARVHCYFNHPKPYRMNAVVKPGTPLKTHPTDFTRLANIVRSCDVFQLHAEAPHRFLQSMQKDSCIFNILVSLDLMSLNKFTVVHIADVDTKLGSDFFTWDQSMRGVWRAFENISVNLYLDYPAGLSYDQGPQFTNTM